MLFSAAPREFGHTRDCVVHVFARPHRRSPNHLRQWQLHRGSSMLVYAQTSPRPKGEVMRSFRFVVAAILLTFASNALQASNTFRLSDGITAYVPNEEGKAFTVTLDVRDINLMETGPARSSSRSTIRPAGPWCARSSPMTASSARGFCRRSGPGITKRWYYAYCACTAPSRCCAGACFSAADRFAAHPKRTFTYPIPAGPKGIYRIELVGMQRSLCHLVARSGPVLRRGRASDLAARLAVARRAQQGEPQLPLCAARHQGAVS